MSLIEVAVLLVAVGGGLVASGKCAEWLYLSRRLNQISLHLRNPGIGAEELSKIQMTVIFIRAQANGAAFAERRCNEIDRILRERGALLRIGFPPEVVCGSAAETLPSSR